MRLTVTSLVLLTGLALPAQGALAAAAGVDWEKVGLFGVALGESLGAVEKHWPDAKVTYVHNDKVKTVVTDGLVTIEQDENGVSRKVVAHLTYDKQVYSVEADEKQPETALGHPSSYVEAWIKRFGPTSTDYDPKNETSPIYLTWFSKPELRRNLTVSLRFERAGDCATLHPEGMDCSQHESVFGKFEARYLLRDQAMEIENQRRINRILTYVSSLAKKKGKKKK